MRKIVAPENINCVDNISIAFKYVDGSQKYYISDDELQIVKAIYEKYDEVGGTGNDEFKSVLLSDYLNNALADSYNEVQKKRRLQNLRETILLSVNRCPYCGISDADELDHHLPQSIYKATSIYSRNLIPICHKCNNKKRTFVVSGDLKFPHLYFDDFLTKQFLIAETAMNGSALLINFDISSEHLTEQEYNILNFVFRRIDLNTRLLKECNVYLSSFSISLEHSFSEFSVHGVKKFLHAQFIDNQNVFGKNDWRTALIKSLHSCEDFCDGGFRKYYKD